MFGLHFGCFFVFYILHQGSLREGAPDKVGWRSRCLLALIKLSAYIRLLLQSPSVPAPSQREPLINSALN